MSKIKITLILVILLFTSQAIYCNINYLSIQDLEEGCNKKYTNTKFTHNYYIYNYKYCKLTDGKVKKVVLYINKNWEEIEKSILKNYVFSNGSKYKKEISTYKKEKLVKSEIFNYVFYDGDKYKKQIITYKDGKTLKAELFNYYLKSKNKIYKSVIKKEENNKKIYYSDGNIIKTRPIINVTREWKDKVKVEDKKILNSVNSENDKYNQALITYEKDKFVAYALLVVFGTLGIHRFYIGKIGTGIIYFFTAGLLYFGVIFDLITLSRQVDLYNANIYNLRRRE